MSGFPDGHFYSPVVNLEEARADQQRIWKKEAWPPGIDFNDASHKQLLQDDFPRYWKDFNYKTAREETVQPFEFYLDNGLFSGLDALALFVFLRRLGPKKMIEVGSGLSSLLSADVNRTYLGNNMELTCIEPFPSEILKDGVPGITKLIAAKVQETPTDLFAGLAKGDVLFIDSSHVSKTGSDVNFLFFEIIPRLQIGVHIHFHDIFLPNEYPKKWVLELKRSWNEQYLLQSFLMYNSAFQVLFSSCYSMKNFRELLQGALNGRVTGGGSLWLHRIR